MTKIVLDNTGRNVTSDRVEIDLSPERLAKAVAQPIAAAIAAGIRRAGWVKTGTLARGVAATADGSAVVVPGDRLVRDPRLRERLAKDVPELAQPYTPAVRKNLEVAFRGSFTVQRRRR